MKLTFLGTAAAEGYPALWCRCERCTTARQRGGRNLRFRSSLLINDDLLIDPGPDVLAAAIRLNLDLAPVRACLVTHPHTDHLTPSTFYWRRKGFVATELPLLEVYASGASLDRMLRHEGRDVDPEAIKVKPNRIGAYQSFEVETAERRYRVWSFAATHAEPTIEPMFFAVREEGERAATLLYATDSGPWSEETWRALERLGGEGVRFDVTAIDSTSGLGPDSKGHMNLRQMVWHQDELRRQRLLVEEVQRLAHHFSHNGTPPYEELVEHLASQGVVPAYDGLVVNA